MKQGSLLLFILYLSRHVFAQVQENYLIEECVKNNYTELSCEKVFCQPWQTCITGTCHCKIPYQCPKNGTSVCSNIKKSFQTYCQLKSYECRQRFSKFLSRGSCNPEGRFNVFFNDTNAWSEGIIQVEINNSNKSFICGKGLTIHEANVICRHLGFVRGADSKDSIEPDEDQGSLECLKATCRGTETRLAECGLRKMRLTTGKLAKVTCNSREHRDCNDREFRCVNGKCIRLNKICDGMNDCGDLSDELCCKACKRKHFHCNSDVCIPSSYVCNNELDCLTGEDELNCNKTGKTKAEESNQVIESMDEERKRIKTLLPVVSCGIRNHTVTRRKRIIGGFTAQPLEFPWQVAIRGEGHSVNCGGTYIGGCWVLTAAHCVRKSRLHIYRIWTGMLDSLKFNTRIETYSLENMIIHENYNSKTYENDIALLEMRTKNRGTPCSPPDTVPACIPWSQYMFRSGQQCKVSGWGFDEEFTRQYILKWGYVNLMDNCTEIYKNRYFKGMECAGTDDGSVDACKGDSGGPLVCFDPNNVGYLWGIVSWGENCGERGHPGVYTKVAHYFDWIARHTGISLISKYNV
ncbi:complement factor I isoform X1 [Pseudonaja textilis]|uniref:complement factor I isoform X1 n=1 Tax=Pseudonaja textilis TaxID=8673 RepID=UPI000EAA3920|nr:complement factor I isoform X1 [Pseudonaja textilis]